MQFLACFLLLVVTRTASQVVFARWSGPGCTLRVVSFRIHWFNDRPDAPTRRDGVAGEESETPSAKPRVGEKVEVFSNSARRHLAKWESQRRGVTSWNH